MRALRSSGWEDFLSGETNNFNSLGVGDVDLVVIDDESFRYLGKGFRSYLEKLAGNGKEQVVLLLSDLVDADIREIHANVIRLEWDSCRESSRILP